jgi:uncharacterized protein (TIGR02646 family)
MRPLRRIRLAPKTQEKLQNYQTQANVLLAAGNFDSEAIESFWTLKRQRVPFQRSIPGKTRHRSALDELYAMTGARERCMYCMDSHGTDIEHYYPKTSYPKRMFRWRNLLICCSGCNTLKGKKFPLDRNHKPLLINPTTENPWNELDFDPTTGIIVARPDPITRTVSPRGAETVKVLQFEERQAVADGYLFTYELLEERVQTALTTPPASPAETDAFIAKLKRLDDHGLLVWCFHALGANTAPFNTLRTQNPTLWADCVAATAPPTP